MRPRSAGYEPSADRKRAAWHDDRLAALENVIAAVHSYEAEARGKDPIHKARLRRRRYQLERAILVAGDRLRLAKVPPGEIRSQKPAPLSWDIDEQFRRK
jgi:hypothetical protein